MEIEILINFYVIGYVVAFMTNIYYYGAEELTKRIWFISFGSWLSIIIMIWANKD